MIGATAPPPAPAQSGGVGNVTSTGQNPAVGGLSSVVPGWQGPLEYSTVQADMAPGQVAAQQATAQQAAQQAASGILGSFFGTGAGFAPHYNPSYQQQYPQAYAQAYAQAAQQTAGGA